MSEQYIEEEHISWTTRLSKSCLGIIFGFLLFLVSLYVLFWNEGRTDLAQIAKIAIEIPASASSSNEVGKFISVTGNITSKNLLGDNLFLQPGPYIKIDRQVEMYAWTENTSTETTRNIGGSETKKTTYTYEKKWDNNPISSQSFRYPEGHYNPTKNLQDYTGFVKNAKLGSYKLNLKKIRFPPLKQLTLQTASLKLQDNATLTDNYIYLGQNQLSNPQIGDLRLSYFIFPRNQQVTIFGKLNPNNKIGVYSQNNKISFYRMFSGTRTQAISTLKNEHNFWTWFWRIAGFLMMWIGLTCLVEPVNVFLDFFPFFGSISRGISGISSFIIAFVLSTITILFSSLLHNFIALTLSLLVIFTIIITTKKLKD